MGQRKIVQIVVVPITPKSRYEVPMLYALCNDGTLWWINVRDGSSEWQLEESIPQGPIVQSEQD